MVCAGSQGPSDKAHIPLGLIYVGSALERNGYNVKIWHLLPEEFEDALPEIRGRQPLWVGLSVLSGMTTFYAAQLSRRIREEIPKTSIVWGGHHASAVPDECIRKDYIDYVIHGEGEETAVEFSDALLSSSDLSGILGLGFKDKNRCSIVNSKRPLAEDLDRYELNWELVNVRNYMNRNSQGKIPMTFYSSRGCPYKCAFCATPLYTGKSFRAHSPEFVTKNLFYMKETYGFDSVFFADDNFMLDANRGLEIIRRLTEGGVSVDTLDVRLNQLNEEILAKFRDYGVCGVFFGYESGNDRILTLMNKGIDVDYIKKKVILLKEYNIVCWASGIVGIPTETREEMYETIDFSMWLRDTLPEGSTVSVYRYMPLPKTKLLELAIQKGFQYPTCSEDWRKIDPIGPYYKMEWIPWITEQDEAFIVAVQETSRTKMLNYIYKHNFIANSINNIFVRHIRSRVRKRKLRFDWELRLFEVMRDIYGKLRFGKIAGFKSQAVKRGNKELEQ
ncbi:MAG: radical SAM protein [bacterium]|nr:radical SAM protein [bacterium]